MKIILAIFIFVIAKIAYADVKVTVCQAMAGMAKDLALLKENRRSEDEIRNFILILDKEQRAKKSQHLSNQSLDSILEERIEILIWLFDKKNLTLSPSQVYSIKFAECFKSLREKGY